jgi:hypothetical protein
MRSDSKPNLYGYGAAAIKGRDYPLYAVPVSPGGTPTYMQDMYVIMGWLAYCGNPAIYAYSDYMAARAGSGGSSVEQLSPFGIQPD